MGPSWTNVAEEHDGPLLIELARGVISWPRLGRFHEARFATVKIGVCGGCGRCAARARITLVGRGDARMDAMAVDRAFHRTPGRGLLGALGGQLRCHNPTPRAAALDEL